MKTMLKEAELCLQQPRVRERQGCLLRSEVVCVCKGVSLVFLFLSLWRQSAASGVISIRELSDRLATCWKTEGHRYQQRSSWPEVDSCERGQISLRADITIERMMRLCSCQRRVIIITDRIETGWHQSWLKHLPLLVQRKLNWLSRFPSHAFSRTRAYICFTITCIIFFSLAFCRLFASQSRRWSWNALHWSVDNFFHSRLYWG